MGAQWQVRYISLHIISYHIRHHFLSFQIYHYKSRCLLPFSAFNQSINPANFYSANIPGEARLSGASQWSRVKGPWIIICSTKFGFISFNRDYNFIDLVGFSTDTYIHPLMAWYLWFWIYVFYVILKVSDPENNNLFSHLWQNVNNYGWRSTLKLFLI